MRTIRSVSDIEVNLFDSTEARTIITALGLTYTNADQLFKLDYEEAQTQYTDTEISFYCEMVFLENKRKYIELLQVYQSEYDPIENYNSTETGTETRTPNLSTEFEAGTTDTQTIKNNQTHTTTGSTEAGATTTNGSTTYDSTAMVDTTKSVDSSESSNTITETYSGSADQNTTTRSGTNTTTETGTETIEKSLSRHGNIGVTTSQQMIDSSLTLAPKLNIFKIIEKDISNRILLQVWE